MCRIYFSATMQYVVSCLFNDTFNNSVYTDRDSKLDICGGRRKGLYCVQHTRVVLSWTELKQLFLYLYSAKQHFSSETDTKYNNITPDED